MIIDSFIIDIIIIAFIIFIDETEYISVSDTVL